MLNKVIHSEMIDFLKSNILERVFPLYIANKNSEKKSFGEKIDGAIKGTLISGVPFNLYEVYSYWLFSESEKFVDEVISYIKETKNGFCLNFETKYLLKFKEEFKDKVSIDYYYLKERCGKEVDKPKEVEKITFDLLQKIEVSSELRDRLGGDSFFENDVPFFGYIEQGELIAVCEYMVQFENCASIQQIYTKSVHRKKGYAFKLCQYVVSKMIRDGLKVSYLTEETNTSSQNLALKLGFIKHSEFGYLEI